MSEDSVDCTPQLSDQWRKYTKNTLNDKTEEKSGVSLSAVTLQQLPNKVSW